MRSNNINCCRLPRLRTNWSNRTQKMSLCKVGNQTSSQDPQAVNSRVFVGNLNTFQVTKTDVEKIFQRYGKIAGISMHKGYAFVQFTVPFDARSACLGEDGKLICGQILDVNMVSEPKAHQGKTKPEKRPGDAADTECLSNGQSEDEDSQKTFQSKRPKVDETKDRPSSPFTLTQLKHYDNPDTLICGNCKDMFHSIDDMINHKQYYCKLRFTCKCVSLSFKHKNVEENGIVDIHHRCDRVLLLCSSCHQQFSNSLDLVMHVQESHGMLIFEEIEEGQPTNDISTEQLATMIS